MTDLFLAASFWIAFVRLSRSLCSTNHPFRISSPRSLSLSNRLYSFSRVWAVWFEDWPAVVILTISVESRALQPSVPECSARFGFICLLFWLPGPWISHFCSLAWNTSKLTPYLAIRSTWRRSGSCFLALARPSSSRTLWDWTWMVPKSSYASNRWCLASCCSCCSCYCSCSWSCHRWAPFTTFAENCAGSLSDSRAISSSHLRASWCSVAALSEAIYQALCDCSFTLSFFVLANFVESLATWLHSLAHSDSTCSWYRGYHRSNYHFCNQIDP